MIFSRRVVDTDTNITEAFWYEQNLIKSNWGDLLLLNKQYKDQETCKLIFLTTNRTKETTDRILATKLEKRYYEF